MDIQKEIALAKERNKETIRSLEMQNAILDDLLGKHGVLTEEEWKRICSTPLKDSEVLCDIVKNYIFPEAQNLSMRTKHVRFTVNGFTCYLPTMPPGGVEIDTGWYRSFESCQDIYHEKVSQEEEQMRKYFAAKAEHADWKTLARLRIPDCPDWELAILWFCWYRWRNDREEYWKVQFALTDTQRKFKEERTKLTVREMQCRVKLFEQTILYLKQFSGNIKKEEKIREILNEAAKILEIP